MVPDLDRIDPVPMAALTGLQQEIDAGSRGALLGRFLDPGLAIMPALGVWLQPQKGNDLIGLHSVLS
jgi:hypothetical protein